MQTSATAEQTPKELLKQQLRSLDPAFRYYKSLFNVTSDLIAVTDGSTVLDANSALVRFFAARGIDVLDGSFSFPSVFEKVDKYGYVYEGYESRRWFETILRGDKEHYRVAIAGVDKQYDFNITIRLLEPVEDVFVATLTDVTEMMGYKTALEEGIKSSVSDRDKMQFLIRQYDKAIEAATMTYKCNLEGNITYANKALCDVLRYKDGELVGKHSSILQGPNVDPMTCNAIWEKVTQGQIYQGVIQYADKLGGLHYFNMSMIPIHDKEKNIIEYFSIQHEITEVMQAKKAAIQTLEAKTKFFNQVSHEIRTPLNAIINFTDQAIENFDDIASDEESREMVRMFLERAYKNSQQLFHLINSLLDMAKISAGKEKYIILPSEVTSIVRDVYESTSGLNQNEAIEYLLDLPSYPILIECDVVKFRQIVTNLISNALKFTEWGFVELRVKEVNHECWIEVEDSGIGIPQDKLERVFEPFEQVGAHDKGTGLGLGIVNEYCKAMDIALEVESSPENGSCFRLKAKMIKTQEDELQWSI